MTMSSLPTRSGPRPKTTPWAPHIQKDQLAPPEWQDELKRRVFALPDVEERDGTVAHPAERAIWLRERGVETVVLVGVATGMAINIAAYQLADRLFSLIVPSDCVTDGNRQLHDAIMSGIMPVISLVTTADDVIAHL
jgi:nicotinamidase-related amidase